MKIERTTMVLAGGLAVYVAVAAFSSTGSGESRLSLLQRILHPVPDALADLSGGRLKSKYIAGADGSRLYEPDVLHDTALDVDCAFSLAADQQIRCLPTLAPASVGTDLMYSDSKCTKAIVQLNAQPVGCPPAPPKYAFTVDNAPYCGAPNNQTSTHVYPVGQLIGASPPGLYLVGGNGACVPPQGGAVGTFVWYSLGAEMAASAFAAGTVGTDP